MRIPASAVCIGMALVSISWCREPGRMEGTVRDVSGAVIPGALVLCVGEDTGFRFQVEVGAGGAYALTLPEGRYDVVVWRTGLSPLARIGVWVAAASSVRVDFEVGPEGPRKTIVVDESSEATRLQESGVTLLRRDVGPLPRNDSSLTGWLWFAPGILTTPANRGEPGQFSSLGGRPNTNNFTVDGVSGNSTIAGAGWPSLLPGGKLPAMTALGTTHALASFDSIREVTVVSQGDTPDSVAASPGATIVVRTQFGSNQMHGSLSGGIRPARLGANDWFANRYHLESDAPSLNQESVAWGGSLRRDRTFVFGAAEQSAVQQGYAWTTTVPSRLARSLSPLSLSTLLNEFPAPNGRDLTLGISELFGERRQPADFITASIRLDHQISQDVRFFLRLSAAPSWSKSGFTQTNLTQYRNLTGVFGSTLTHGASVHDSRVSFSQNRAVSTWSIPENGAAPAPEFYAQNPSLAADSSNIEVGGAGSVLLGDDGRNSQNQWHVSHTSTWQITHHQLHFGFDYLELRPARSGAPSSVTVAFGTPTDLIYGPLVPVWVTYSHTLTNSLRLRRLSIFGLDTWKVGSRLSLTFALRSSWLAPPTVEPGAGLFRVDGFTGQILSLISQRQPLWQGSRIQLSPSVSAAWRLTGRGDTVVRASWAILREGESAAATDQLNGIPYSRLQTAAGPGGDLSNPSGLAPVPLGYGFAQDLRLATYKRWSLAIHRALGSRDSVEAGYSGLLGSNEIRREILLNPVPDLGALLFPASNGVSQYHGLTAAYRRSLTAGLQASASYSWSHSIDLNSSDSTAFLISPVRRPSQDRGSSDFDVRHTFHGALTYSPAVRLSGVVGRIADGWMLAGIVAARTGFPVNPLISETLDGFAVENFRPGLAPGVPLSICGANYPGGRSLNPTAFVYPGGGIPPAGRNAVPGYGMWQTDLAAERSLWKNSKPRISLRIDAYNAFNHAQFADPVRYASNPMFGQSQSASNLMFGGGSPGTGQSPVFLMGAPRSLQASIRVAF